MNPDSKSKLEEILSTILELFDTNDLTAEEGALLSANLFFNSLSHDPNNADFFQSDFIDSMNMLSIFRASNRPFYLLGTDRGWGLDPSLLEEEN